MTSRRTATRPPRGGSATRIYEELRRRILNLVLVPGADLDEAALAADFRVSRTPLREALNRLASENLIVMSPNRGASVAPLSLTDFPAFIEALSLAQGAVNAFAAMRRTAEQLELIRAAASDFETAITKSDLALTEANRTFHSAVAGAARNPCLASFYEKLLDEGARLARVSFSYEGEGRELHLAKVVAEHREMTEAIAYRDAVRAEELGHRHAALFQARMMDYLTANAAASLRPVAGRAN